MVKSFSAASTPSIGDEPQLTLDNLAAIFRNPALSGLSESQVTTLLLRGALFTLEQDGSPEAVAILLEGAFAPLPDPIPALALTTLERLALTGCQPAWDAIYLLAVVHDNPTAYQFIQQRPIQGNRTDLQAIFLLISGRIAELRHLDPKYQLITRYYLSEALPDLQHRVIEAANTGGLNAWSVIVAAAKLPSADSYQRVHNQFPSFQEAERQLALDLLEQQAKDNSVLARDTICQIFIDYEYTPARTLALANGFSPSTAVQSALFYFLAEQWQIYEYLDFNQSLLAAAYESASPNIRKRILFLSRYSGRIEWMEGLSTTSRQRWLWDLNDADWELAVNNLRTSSHYTDLWKLAQVAPPAWSRKILGVLAGSGWQPDLSEENEGYHRLITMAAAIDSDTPPISRIQTWPSPSPDITCMALNQDGSRLAVAGSNSTVHQWGIYKTASPLPPIIGPTPQTRALAFSPDGEYLATSNGDYSIRAYRLTDGKLVKSFEGHAALVRSLAFSPDGRTLFSASFDGTLRAWRFPQGPELKRIDVGKSELFGVAASPDGQILLTGGSDHQLHVFRWPDGDKLWEISGHKNTITSLVNVLRGQLAASAGRDGMIFLWNYVAGRSISQLSIDELVTALAFHPNEQFLVGGTAQGNVLVWNVSTGKKIESITAHPNLVTGLAMSPDGQQLFTACVDGTVSIWDLQLFTWSLTPIGSNRSQTLALVEQRLRQAAQKPEERNWLLLIADLIRWRQRFDVEIDDAHQVISVGEFDIEL
jgi:WD40 repeat protein